MISSLIIENFVLIDKLVVDFSKGFNVLTGETGAGKSIIVDAIQIVTGGKASSEQIKTGQKQAYIEGTFDITEPIKEILSLNGFDDLEQTITLSRTIQKTNSKCRINGQLVSLSIFKEIGDELLDVIGQNDNQHLFKIENHKKIIDSLGDENHKTLLEQIKTINTKLSLVKKEYDELNKTAQENKRQLDFFKFQLEEIDEAELIFGEDDELKKEREVLVHAEELIKNLNSVYYDFYESNEDRSLYDRLNFISRTITESARYDEELNEYVDQLDGALIQIEEVIRSIKSRVDNISSDAERLSEVENRLNIIIKLKNKYGKKIEDILNFAEELRNKVNLAENSEEKLVSLEKEIINLEKKYKEISIKITDSRKNIAEELEPAIEKELAELGMTKTKFKVNMINKIDTFSNLGNDAIEFLISPNPGEPLRSLSKTASGGESSRITLALKMVLHKQNQIPTLIFDEIDAGISGKSALIVSEKIGKLSTFSQIICITHLPVVACMADNHFWIEKIVKNDFTKVDVSILDEKQKIEKLAQISGGQINESSLKYAQEIYTNAINFKKALVLS
ncbi:MAG: DNA repair protein RecN [Candidatus Sericytochromatia bacterium]